MSNYDPNLSEQIDQDKDEDGVDQSIDEYETDSKILEYLSLRTMKGRKDAVSFFRNILPNFGKVTMVSTAFDYQNFPNKKSDFLGYFINERNYLVGDTIKLKFKLNKENKNFKKEMKRLMKKPENNDLYTLNG